MPFFRQNAENRTGLSKRTAIGLASVGLALALGISVAVPIAQRSRVRAREAQLIRRLEQLRQAIRTFETNSARSPQSVAELVGAGLLREVPVDPFTGRSDTWRFSTEPAVEIRSGSDRLGLNGKLYSSW